METQEVADLSTQAESSAISLASTSFWCQTTGVVKDVDFEWTIERLAYFLDDGGNWEPLTSAEFSVSKFELSINVDTLSNVEVNLLCSNKTFLCPLRVEIAISNEKCQKVFQKTTRILQNTVFPVTVFQISKRALLESVNLVNGNITIYCKIGILIRQRLTGKATATPSTERYIHKTPIRDDDRDLVLLKLEELFEKMPLSDVTFNIRGRQFSAQKNILAMRSTVCAAIMFLHPTKEELTSEVEVEDFDPDVFQEVLRYLYTGLTRSTIMDVMATGILAAAEKYLLDHLKTRCETHLICQMSAKNCMDMLALTTHNPAEQLKKYAIEYFRRNPSEVVETEHWKKMKEENPACVVRLATNGSHRPDCLEVPMMSVYVHFSVIVFITRNHSAGEIISLHFQLMSFSNQETQISSCGLAFTWTQVLFYNRLQTLSQWFKRFRSF